jgi:hypothetical protein
MTVKLQLGKSFDHDQWEKLLTFGAALKVGR